MVSKTWLLLHWWNKCWEMYITYWIYHVSHCGRLCCGCLHKQYIWGCWATFKPERLCTVWKIWVFMSNLHPQYSRTLKMWPSCAGVYLLWLFHPQRRTHGSATLCQRRLTHLSIMIFWMILTFRLSRVHQHHQTDIYLLLILSDSKFKGDIRDVSSLRPLHWGHDK